MNKIQKENLSRMGAGRPKGSGNKTTALLKEAIITAATKVGSDTKGRGGLVGYCTFLAKTEPKAFAQLLGKVLPMQLTGADDGPLQVVVKKFTLGDDSAS